jgi:hypothetical protein
VQVAPSASLEAAQGRFLVVSVLGLRGHEVEPVVEFALGHVAVEGEQVGHEKADVIDSAAVVVEVAPEQDPCVTDLAGPSADREAASELGLHGANAGH